MLPQVVYYESMKRKLIFCDAPRDSLFFFFLSPHILAAGLVSNCLTWDCEYSSRHSSAFFKCYECIYSRRQIDKSADFMESIHGAEEGTTDSVSHLSTAVEIPGRKGRNGKMITNIYMSRVLSLPCHDAKTNLPYFNTTGGSRSWSELVWRGASEERACAVCCGLHDRLGVNRYHLNNNVVSKNRGKWMIDKRNDPATKCISRCGSRGRKTYFRVVGLARQCHAITGFCICVYLCSSCLLSVFFCVCFVSLLCPPCLRLVCLCFTERALLHKNRNKDFYVSHTYLFIFPIAKRFCMHSWRLTEYLK
jgi:hypothetical protein